jgi:hypothetical protein
MGSTTQQIMKLHLISTTQCLLQDWNVFTRTTERVSRMEELASYAIELHRNIDRIYIVSV